MTTRVLMMSVQQKRRAQWSLLPKNTRSEDADEEMDRDQRTPAKASARVATRSAGAAGPLRSK